VENAPLAVALEQKGPAAAGGLQQELVKSLQSTKRRRFVGEQRRDAADGGGIGFRAERGNGRPARREVSAHEIARG
jgi:hypothetical protein